MPPNGDSGSLLTNTYEIIGICIIVVSVIVFIIRVLCKSKKKRKRRDLEYSPEIDPPPKKTAADHLEEIKEATQKILRPLSIHTSKESLSPLDSSSLFSFSKEEERRSLSYANSTRGSKSFSKKVESRPRSKNGSKYSSKYGSGVGSPGKNSLITKSRESSPQPPPSSFSKTSRMSYKTQSRIQSHIGPRTPSLKINSSIPSQLTYSTSSSPTSSQSSSPPSRVSLEIP